MTPGMTALAVRFFAFPRSRGAAGRPLASAILSLAALMSGLLGCGGTEEGGDTAGTDSAAGMAVTDRTGYPPILPGGGAPNVLLISIDSLRADHVGAYGYERDTTPAFDAIAEEGTLFEYAFAPRGLTYVSLASLMTGRYPVSHGVRYNGLMLSDDETPLAKVLRNQGYATAAFIAPNAKDQNWQAFDRFETGPDETLTEHAVEWLQENKDNQFFLWVHYFSPHRPYTPPPPYDSRFTEQPRGAFGGDDHSLELITLHQIDVPREELDYIIAQYDGAVAKTDDEVKTVIDAVKELGVYDNTLLVIVSDHGDDLYDHNRYFYHSTSVYDATLHVPLVFRMPGVAPAGGRVPSLVQLIDVTPTILDLLDLDIPSAVEGASLVPAFRGEPLDLGPAFAEHGDTILTVRTDRYRFVLNPTDFDPWWINERSLKSLVESPFYQAWLAQHPEELNRHTLAYSIDTKELYDLEEGGPESENIVDSATDVTREMLDLLHRWQQRYGWEFEGGISGSVDPRVREELEALGYVF